MSAEHFAGRLRELRDRAGLTQDQLAEKAGVKRDAVARWERKIREPSWSNVIALADALGVSCEEFRKRPREQPALTPGRPRKRAPGRAEGSAAKRSTTEPKRGRARATS